MGLFPTVLYSMAIRVPAPEAARPLVDQIARNISDPVGRLRFLKAVAPVAPGDTSARLLYRKRWLLLALAVTASLASLLFLRSRAHPDLPPAPMRMTVPALIMAPVTTAQLNNSPDVWPVERSGDSETYSNGLRIDSRFVIATRPRSYVAFPADDEQPAEHRTQPAGIVFHSTESLQAPFEARENGVLKRIGESLLEYVRRHRSYNFLIDRFGRVYRVVPEDQVANHAGYSLWADDNWAYINLNESFLGVSFEAETRQPEISPGQIRSATMLIEMLRSRYGIAAANCVTHAQVSVNLSNMRVGYHFDWASGLPFDALGLPDNYAVALPSLWQFGFESDATFRGVACARLQAALDDAENRFAEGARAAGLQPEGYRKLLRQKYRKLLAEARHGGSGEGPEPE
jgi:hypothetical protein